MKKTILLVAIVIAASLSIFGQPADTQKVKLSKTEQDVANFISEYATAIIKRDTTTIERSLADDYMDISPSGGMASKTQVVDSFKSPVSPTASKLEAIETSDSKTRVYGDAAVMTFRLTFRGQTAKGEAISQDLGIWTAVVAKIKGKWQIVSTQGTPIPPPKPATTSTN